MPYTALHRAVHSSSGSIKSPRIRSPKIFDSLSPCLSPCSGLVRRMSRLALRSSKLALVLVSSLPPSARTKRSKVSGTPKYFILSRSRRVIYDLLYHDNNAQPTDTETKPLSRRWCRSLCLRLRRTSGSLVPRSKKPMLHSSVRDSSALSLFALMLVPT